MQVFERSLSEISLEAIDTVLELIRSNTLYKGTEWKGPITELRTHKVKFESLPAEKRGLYGAGQGKGHPSGGQQGKARRYGADRGEGT